MDPKPHQLFFGRYFLFFVMSQIQAAVIVAGDLLVLKIQCVEPALLFATGAITSLVFSLLIYALSRVLRRRGQGRCSGGHGAPDRRLQRHVPH